MAELVVGCIARVAEDDTVVGGIRVSITCLAFCREQCLGRFSPLGPLNWFWDCWDERDGLVHIAARLCARGQWRV